MPASKSHSCSYFGSPLVACALLMLCGHAVAYADPTPAERAIEAMARQPQIALGRFGVTVEVLVAAGATPAEVGGVARLGVAHLAEFHQEISNAEAALVAARTALRQAELDRSSSTGPATGGEGPSTTVESALSAAQTAVFDAEATLNAVRSALLSAATAELSNEVRARVNTILANRKWGVEMKYLVKSRTDTEWSQLSAAIRVVNDASRGGTGEQVQDAQATIAAANADSEVAAAQNRLQSSLQASRSAWSLAETAALAEHL